MDSLNSEGICFKRPSCEPSNLRTKGNKRKRPTGELFGPNEDIFRTYEQPSETIPRRIELFEENLDTLQHHVQRLQEKFNDQLSKNLKKFIDTSFQLIDRVDSVIPIGILESSLSVGENSAIFDYIENELKNLPGDNEEKVYVSRIQSGTSLSTKAAFQKIFSQIVDKEVSYIEDEDSEESSPVKREQGVNKKLSHFSLFDVNKFLASNHKYRIVIIIEDADVFVNLIITQILTLLGSAKLPITFIFGVTHGHFIQNLIPLNSSSEYVLEKFYSVSPKDRFDDFMRRVLLEQTVAFRISGPIVSYLNSQYKEQNFSVEQISSSIKFCLRYHFLSAKSAFCSFQKAEDYPQEQLKLFEDTCKSLNASGETPRKRIKSSKKSPQEMLDSSVEGIRNWYFFLKLICFINLRLPDCPLGDSYATMYISCYGGYTSSRESDEKEALHRFFRALGSISKDDLRIILQECISFLQKPKFEVVGLKNDVLLHLEELLGKLDEGEHEPTKEVQTAKPIIPRKVKGLKLAELQQKLLEEKRQNDGLSTVYSVRAELIEKLKKLLKKFLIPLDLLENSKIFVFDDLNQVINALYPANFLQLNEDITSPGYALQCACCSDIDPTSIDANLPDISIIHKLFSEHTTKKVDLNLVYRAFLSVVQPQTSGTGRKSKASNSTKEAEIPSYLMRFRRAVGELQHMGFVKRTKAKPDEVTILTWW